MIRTLLIANRGEIACRIIRTARRLGIKTVAVYSEADAGALHVRCSDVAIPIGPAPAKDSYLAGERLISEALQAGADAVHPGYGFLSENAGFAAAVLDAGLIWVGPNPAAISAMGLKDAAKSTMIAAGVPVIPGYLGKDQSDERLSSEAVRIGYPVLIKAIAGGGGKGMRKVDEAAGFAAALASCRREASASFGNANVLIERYISCPRHIEVQVFGDRFGTVLHMFERDCSLQRRHQKVIEEAPAPGMDPATRETICAAAVRAAKAVGYESAGTVEFIADASAGLRADRIWFMEMNTRLQVEHPVTEAITGVDLVEWQLRIAAGEPLPLRQEQLKISGHAIEARLYAEDPARGFLPATGRLERLHLDPAARIDSGVSEGDTIGPHYDPMIAKLIVLGPDRESARCGLMAALDRSFVAPLRTNQGFLYECLADEDFAAARLDTGLIERKGEALIPPAQASQAAADAAATRLLSGNRLSGFRLNRERQNTVALWADGTAFVGRGKSIARLATSPVADGVLATERGQTRRFTLRPPRPSTSAAAGGGVILAPMPGTISAIHVSEGDAVTKGQKLLTLEAMKMEHGLTAPFDGIVAELRASPGSQVQAETLLARIEATSGSPRPDADLAADDQRP